MTHEAYRIADEISQPQPDMPVSPEQSDTTQDYGLSPAAIAYRAALRATPPDPRTPFREIGRITPEDDEALRTTGSRQSRIIINVADIDRQ